MASEEEQVASPPIATTDADKVNLRLLTAKPKKLRSVPQLVSLKKRQRTVLGATQTDRSLCRVPPLPLPEACLAPDPDLAAVEAVLGIRPVTTPSSGNCMAMAVAQAYVDHDLAAFDDTLETTTASIKRGIRWSA